MGVPFDYAQGGFSIAFGCHLISLWMIASLAKNSSAEERSFVGMTPKRQWSTMNDVAGFRWARLSKPESGCLWIVLSRSARTWGRSDWSRPKIDESASSQNLGQGLFMTKKRRKLHGTVQKVIKPAFPHEKEKAEIGIQEADELYREIRVENVLTDAEGHKARLKPGAQVDVVLEADSDATLKQPDEDSKKK